MQLSDKKVLVFGAGKSGISASKLLLNVDAIVVLYDGNVNLKTENLKDKLEVNHKNFSLVTGELTNELLQTMDLVVLSPGVPTDLPIVERMREFNLTIWGEIELAYQFSKGKIVGITGTNGKTTTTALVGEIMKTYYQSVYVVGNIGDPYTDYALEMKDETVSVAELSSFQLETICEFRPDVSAILNITPDHLNRHHTMEHYIEAKQRIGMKQTKEDVCVLNYEDEVLRNMASDMPAKVLFFSSARSLQEGVYLEGEEIIYSHDGQKNLVCNINELNVFGMHSYENVMAGVAIGVSMDVPMKHIKTAITNFKAVEHRIEYVETIDGVKYYNDSKGTNPDAAIKAVKAMKQPTLLIGGGYDKQSEYDEWIESFDGKVKYLILLGETKYKIEETARNHGFTDIIIVDDLKTAVKVCAEKSQEGDNVLLSPACASWDMFDSFEQRGNLFKQYVRELSKCSLVK